MTKIVARYTCEEHDITIDSSNLDVTGEIAFVSGMLARITESKIQGSKLSPLSHARYYTHKILAFDHITNARGH